MRLKSIVVGCCLIILLVQTSAIVTAAQQKQEQQSSAGVSAQVGDDQLDSQVVALFNAGKYKEALPIARKVLAAREKSAKPNPDKVTVARINLAQILISLDQRSEAAKIYEQMLKESEAKNGADSIMNTPILDKLAWLSYYRGEFDRTEKFYRKSLDIRIAIEDPNSEDVSKANNNLAEFYRLTGNFRKAEPFYLSAIKAREAGLPATKDLLTKSLKGYQCLLYEDGRAKEYSSFSKTLSVGTGSSVSENFGAVLNGKAISLPVPRYPEIAKGSRMLVRVVIQVAIDESGSVTEATDVCGASPEFAQSAIGAARLAKFTPTLFNGKPAKVTGEIVYNYDSR